jgi:hypothetical protein
MGPKLASLSPVLQVCVLTKAWNGMPQSNYLGVGWARTGLYAADAT